MKIENSDVGLGIVDEVKASTGDGRPIDSLDMGCIFACCLLYYQFFLAM